MSESRLPVGIVEIIEYLAQMAEGYDNHLKWNEQAKFKADLMNVRARWTGVDTAAFRQKCLTAGMRSEDVTKLVEWLDKAKAGRRLIPQHSYRTFRFMQPAETPSPSERPSIRRSGSLKR